MSVILNVLGFKAGWTVLLYSGVSGALLGFLIGIFLVGLQVVLFKEVRVNFWLIVLLAVLSSVCEFLMMSFGVYSFPSYPISLGGYPLWMSVIWILFYSMMPLGLTFLHGRLMLASGIGMVGSACSYYGGQSFGGMNFDLPVVASLLCISLFYGILMPLTLTLWSRYHTSPSL